MQTLFSAANLMLAPDGTIFHLRIPSSALPDTVVLVGDPSRVAQIANHLNRPVPIAANREFHSVLGAYKGHDILVLSTGIGAGCVDIAITELDVLANIDLDRGELRGQMRHLSLVRIGTSGALQEQVPNGSPIITQTSIGLDGLAYYYDEIQQVIDEELNRAIIAHFDIHPPLPTPYSVPSNPTLLERLSPLGFVGITLSLPGFYGPQGRALRLAPSLSDIIKRATHFRYHNSLIANMEMESGSLNALAAMLGHKAVTICLAIDNRKEHSALTDYAKAMDTLIGNTLDALF